MKKTLLFGGLFILFVLHNDLWYWNNAGLPVGIPIGLLYHVVYCLAASLFFIWLVKRAWPKDLEV